MAIIPIAVDKIPETGLKVIQKNAPNSITIGIPKISKNFNCFTGLVFSRLRENA